MNSKLKKVLIFFLMFVFLFSSFAAYAQDDDGVIDFYTVFSRDDVNKNRVGNSVYNWSIYMPQDAYINKDPKGSYFSMTSNSYKSNISVEAILNKEGYSSLDDILAYGDDILNSYYGTNSKIYSLQKGKDKKNQEYIEMTSVYTDSFYVFIDEEESSGTYNLTRIYLSNNKKYNYIYRLTISMDLNFYKDHKNLLYKIADSFEVNFDSKNPNIKDLADNVTSWRIHKNTSYGWQIELPPYWKTTDIYNLEYNSSTQSFAPLYTDEEMGLTQQEKSQDVVTSVQQQQQQEPSEYLSVSYVANSPMDFDKWVDYEIKDIDLYNKSLYKVNSVKNITIAGAKVKLYELYIQKTLKKRFIEKRLYVDWNNNKYIVKLYVEESKYNKDKQKYDRIINSFKPNQAQSKYLSSIIWKGNISSSDSKRLIKLSKTPFEMSVAKSYRTNIPYYYGYYNEMLIYSKTFPLDTGISDAENIVLYNGLYSMLNITGSINVDPLEKIIKNSMQYWVESNEYKSKTVSMNLQKYSDKDISVYKFSYLYDINKLSELAKENPNRDYNFSTLQNRILYMIKYKQYYYTIDFSVPVLYWNDYIINDFLNSVKTIKIDNISFSKLNIKFTTENMEKFKKKDNE